MTRPDKPRRARPSVPIYERQRHTILGLAGDMSWSQSILTKYLRQFHGCASIEAIRTARKAETIIKGLLKRKQRKQDRRAIHS